MPEQPANSTEIQIGFKRGFNWPFVVQHADTTGWQLTTYMPIAVADGLGISRDKVKTVTLTSYNTTEKLGYVSTLVLLYVPTELVDTLHLDLLNTNSAIYNNKDASLGDTINFLCSFIDPTFPILAGDLSGLSGSGGSGSGSSSKNNGDGNDSNGSGDPMSGSSASASGVNLTAMGVAMGTMGAVSVYGAGMIFVARRYKKKKARHERSSSVPSSNGLGGPGYGSSGSGPWMSGARGGRNTPGGRNSRGSNQSSSNGRSVRTAQISAPVMAENSLGWN